MASLTLTGAFARYDAKLRNAQWAVSAINTHNELVMSCWAHYLGPYDGALRYRDRLSRWDGNKLGGSLLREHLEKATADELPVRLVIARTADRAAVDDGESASSVKKTFGVREDLVGRVTRFDGDELIIDFRRAE